MQGATDAPLDGSVRTILHVDMDAFYVSVELGRRPELRGQAVVVGGTGSRGVVAASSYEARRYGVHSAMPSAVARRLCPHAVFLPGDHDLYSAVSVTVHETFREFTPIVESLGLDEAFLDVTGSRRLHGDGVAIGHHIRASLRDRLDLACSVGVAASKFVAKMASKAAKPQVTPEGVRAGRGVVEVARGQEVVFLHPLPVQALWGVGPATLERLTRLGVRRVGELAELGQAALVAALGTSQGRHLYRLSLGIDDRPVESHRPLKSLSHEETFARDLHGIDELRPELVRLADAVAARLRAHGTGARTLSLKLRYGDFTTITRAVTLPKAVASGPSVLEPVLHLLDGVDLGRGVRLVGVVASHFAQPSQQLTLDELLADGSTGLRTALDGAEWEAASGAIDRIRTRFGGQAIGPASTASGDGLRVVRRGEQQWGPDVDR